MKISTKEVAELLQKGYTRYTKDDKGFGSIQEKYGLKGTEVVELFSCSSLKHRKTILPKSRLEIVDDLAGEDVDTRSIPSNPEPEAAPRVTTSSESIDSMSTNELFS